MLSVVWNDEAEADLVGLVDYIAAQNPHAAERVHDLVRYYSAQIALQPMAFRAGRVEGTRECIVHPNYIVVFHVEPDAVRIVNVLHSARQYP